MTGKTASFSTRFAACIVVPFTRPVWVFHLPLLFYGCRVDWDRFISPIAFLHIPFSVRPLLSNAKVDSSLPAVSAAHSTSSTNLFATHTAFSTIYASVWLSLVGFDTADWCSIVLFGWADPWKISSADRWVWWTSWVAYFWIVSTDTLPPQN
jgi:hypothetical protein